MKPSNQLLGLFLLVVTTKYFNIVCDAGPIGGSPPQGLHDGTIPAAQFSDVDGRSSFGAAHPAESRKTGPLSGLGKSGLQFDGRDDFALIREFNGLPSGTMTASAWVSVTFHKSYNRILSHKWVQNGWNLYTDGSGVARFGVGQDNADFAASKIIFRDRWHHVVGTYDGSYIRIYVDGVPGSRTELNKAQIDASGYLSIGGAEWDPFFGKIDEVRLWNIALSPEAVRRDLVTPPLGTEQGLVGYWKFDEAKGFVARDHTVYGNHAELGQGKRAPRWIQSGAQVTVPCTQPGVPVSVTLEGTLDGGEKPMVYITSIPEIGELYEMDADLGFKPIAASPQEVRNPASRVLYKPPADIATPFCAQFEYRVHDGTYTSRKAAKVMVEVMENQEQCDSRPLTLQGCWGARTQVSVVKPKAPQPKLSIIVPLYNQGHLLGETLESVAAQTFKDYEVIIVDDGSTDDSAKVAKELVTKFQNQGMRMRLHLKRNGGLADARNAGIGLARGEWVLPLDADDLILPVFLEQAFDVLGRNETVNLVIADLKGFGAWEYSWRLPEYDPLDLRYTNMFHCSAIFPRTMWAAVPGGYPPTTLFGYEDWAFWIFAEEHFGVRPWHIKEEQFLYRIRKDSMHQSLLQNQDYGLASVRMLHPGLYPVELLMAAHDKFSGGEVIEKVQSLVKEKVEKFPHYAVPHLMQGLLLEGMATSPMDGHATGYYWDDALASYSMAVDLAQYTDWQPRWRMGLMLQRMGRYKESNATLAALFDDFSGLEDAYVGLSQWTHEKNIRFPLIRE